MDLTVHALDPSRLPHFMDLFDYRAFSDNPDWAGCYCVFNYFGDSDDSWESRTAAENRATAADMISKGTMNGYLAYDGDQPIGWCNAGAKEAYKRFDGLFPSPDNSIRICAVTCFVITPEYRRMGVARALLDYAAIDLAAQGFDIFEAYPSLSAESCAAHYHGYPAMYKAAGFAEHMIQDNFACMRKQLKEVQNVSTE